jgi:predicted nucleotidyltransferase
VWDSPVAVEKPALKPSVALERHRVAVRETASRFRSANPRVFGSVVRGADEEGSDLDILVDALPGRPCSILAPFRPS